MSPKKLRKKQRKLAKLQQQIDAQRKGPNWPPRLDLKDVRVVNWTMCQGET